jgi:hypothetical protein
MLSGAVAKMAQTRGKYGIALYIWSVNRSFFRRKTRYRAATERCVLATIAHRRAAPKANLWHDARTQAATWTPDLFSGSFKVCVMP